MDVPQRIRRYQHIFSIMPGEAIDGLFREDVLLESAGDKILEYWHELEAPMGHTDELGGLQFLEIRSSLPDELLMYADKLSMAHSLELRVPYLDSEIVEYVERLPASFKVRFGSGKWLHRKVCKKFLTKEIITRRKLGFVTPVDEWFKTSVSGKVDSILLDSNSMIYGYLRPGAVRKLVNDHQRGKCKNYKIIFSLILLEEWMRNFH
jgi:asparagine synthase (glutamine-hydrolysing)